MKVINIYGLLFIAIIMIPNVVFAIKCRDGFSNRKINKYLEVAEQIGRFGCFGFMIFNIPGTCLVGGLMRHLRFTSLRMAC